VQNHDLTKFCAFEKSPEVSEKLRPLITHIANKPPRAERVTNGRLGGFDRGWENLELSKYDRDEFSFLSNEISLNRDNPSDELFEGHEKSLNCRLIRNKSGRNKRFISKQPTRIKKDVRR
jgi:hypothetical protein